MKPSSDWLARLKLLEQEAKYEVGMTLLEYLNYLAKVDSSINPARQQQAKSWGRQGEQRNGY